MRKSIIGAALVCALLLVSAVSAWAIGTTGNTSIQYKPSLSSKDAGTKKKPKAVKLGINLTGTTKDGKGQPATSTKLIITVPKGVGVNSKSWPKKSRCSKSKANSAKSDSVCPKSSKGGSGVAHVDGADGAISRTLNVKVYVLTNGNLGFFLRSAPGEAPVVAQMLEGSVSGGRKISIAIPSNVQEPVPGVPTGIRQLKATVSASAKIKGKKRGLVQTTSCPKSKKWKFGFTDVLRDGKLTTSGTLKCKK